MRGCISFDSSKRTSTSTPLKTMPFTDPTSTPETRTGAPILRPATLGNFARRGYRCQKKPPSPLSRKMTVTAMAIAASVMSPIFSSDQPSERVRGIGKNPRSLGSLRQERLQVRIGRTFELARGALEHDEAVAKHDEFGFLGLVLGGHLDRDAAVPDGSMSRDEERVAQLVRHDNRAHALEIAELDDFLVHCGGGDRVEPGRRLV